MEGVLLWDCVCDACDREGRYHTVGRGKDSPPERRGPNWWLLLVKLAIIAIAYWILSH